MILKKIVLRNEQSCEKNFSLENNFDIDANDGTSEVFSFIIKEDRILIVYNVVSIGIIQER